VRYRVRRGVEAWTWAALLWVACPRSARAQEPVFSGASSVAVRSGPLEVTPTWLTSNGFDTNTTRVGGIVPISSYEFFTIPQLDAKYRASTFTLNGTFAAEYAYTPGEVAASKKSNLNNFGELNLLWAKTILRPSFLLWRRNTYARPDFDVGRKSQRIARTYDAGLEWVPGGRLRVGGGFVNDRTRYDADQVFKGVLLNEKLNFDVYTPRMNATVQVRPSMEVGVGLELTRERFLLSQDRNGDGSRVFGILAFAIPGRAFGTVNLGARKFTPRRAPEQRFEGTFIRAGTGVQYGRTNVTVNATRDIGFSYDSGRGYFVVSSGVFNVRRQLPRRLDVEVEATVQKLTYNPLDAEALRVPDLRRLDALMAIGFSIKPWMKVGGNIEREIATGAEQWDAWRMTFYTMYGTKRIRKLDRPLPR
jgi:hypothetical protein